VLPHYIFLAQGQFVRCISDADNKTVRLIHAFDEQKQLLLNGSFAQALLTLLHTPNSGVSSLLQILEKQHDWLAGLSQASLTSKDFQQMVLGDELGLLFLEITDQCNEKCIHCYASSSPACSDFLSLSEIKSVLRQAREMGSPFVQLTGGDPLIHRDLVEVVAYAHALEFEGIEIYTNGLLLNKKLLEQLLPYQPKLAFSLYSPDEAVHDGITQVKGSFKKTVAAMHRAQDLAFQVRIGMAVMQANAGHEQAMLDFVQETFCLDKSHVRFDPVHETGRGASLSTKNISLMPSQNSHMPESTKKPTHHQVVQTDKIESGFISQYIGRRGKLAVCANGDVSPCIFNREHVLSNIRQQTFQEMFTVKNKGLGNKNPSIERWNNCQHQLSCGDCQMVAYTLGAQDE
jgi:MoaA/NifB/PqqE/SkfB family radical SAM enzyme